MEATTDTVLTSPTYYSIIHDYEEIKPRVLSHQNKKSKVNCNKKKCIFQVYLVVTIFIFGLVVAWFLYPSLAESFMKIEFSSTTAATTTAPNMPSQLDDPVTRNDNNCVININLGKSEDRIILYQPAKKYCFHISRSGRYYFALSLRLKCSSQPSQNIYIMLKNKTLENPAIIMNQTLCIEQKSNIFIQKTFEARKYSQIIMESTTSLKGYSGNFLKFEWYEKSR